MNIKKHIPNTITLLNLLCGCIALIYAIDFDFQMALFFVALGIFFDFFDGFFARLFKVSHPLGLQLDSLADMVTSGLVPGFVMTRMISQSQTTAPAIAYIGFIITLGSCLRLARFNIDTRQTDSFIGLPTPANALFILSLPLIRDTSQYEFINIALSNSWFLIGISGVSAFVLNSEIPLFSLKIKKNNISDNKLQIIFVVISLVLLIYFQFLGISLVILLYVLLSIINNLFFVKKHIPYL